MRVEIKPCPSCSLTHWLALVTVRGRVYGCVWAGDEPTRETVLDTWKNDRLAFKPYNTGAGMFC